MISPLSSAVTAFVALPLVNLALHLHPALNRGSPMHNYSLRARVVALGHNCLVSAVSLYITLQPSLQVRPMQRIAALRSLLAWEGAYNAQDLLVASAMAVIHRGDSIKASRSVVYSIAFHHTVIVVLVSVFFALAKRGDYYIAVLLLMSSTNILMHAGLLARKLLSKEAASPIVRAVSVLLPPVFLASRFLIFPWIVHVFARVKGYSYHEAVSNLRPECKIAWLGFTLFNSWLGYLMLRAAKRKLRVN